MRLFLDAEFNGFKGELISLALVPETNCAAGEWYEWMDSPRMIWDKWVFENVYPVLDVLPELGKLPILKSEFRASLLLYIKQFDHPEIITDWHSDVIYFFDVLAGENFKESVPFEGKFTIVNTPEGEPKPEIPHNALSDARALRDWYLTKDAAA